MRPPADIMGVAFRIRTETGEIMAYKKRDRNGDVRQDNTQDQPRPAAPPANGVNKGQEQEIVLAKDVMPSQLPIIPAMHRPLFPKMIVPMMLEDPVLKKMVADLRESSSKHVGIVLRRPNKDKKDGDPVKPADLYEYGVAAEILRVNQPEPDAPLQMMIGVSERCRIKAYTSESPYLVAAVEMIYETESGVSDELKAYSLAIINNIKELIKLNPLFKEELNIFLSRANLNEPGRLADFASAMTTASGEELQEILEALSVRVRIQKALFLLKKELDLSRMQTKINRQIEEKVSRQQRDFFLREQLKAIKKELGLAKEGKDAEIERFTERLKGLSLTPEADERVKEELDKLALIESSSPEFNVSRNYLDWLTSLPWGVFTKDNYNLKTAERVLNRDHYGLKDVKERILEFLAVGILKGSMSGSILCFIGPPGVGKTSVGKSIAESMGRKFYRFSLGGMRDEAEIKGHRRTYIGALPGKFIQAVKTCRSANPVVMLDEIDKVGAGGFHGDPASALLEALDPEQNRDFQDHYLDVRFDLSHVLFICTANVPDTIPKPLLDRMEIIKLPGYIMEEKLNIAFKYLLPKQAAASGLKPGQLKIPPPCMREIIDGYAREPGVRGIENHIKKICRKTAHSFVASGKDKFVLSMKSVQEILGKRVFPLEDPFKKPVPGVVTGLAWTSMGGETIHIEATRVEADKPGFKQTGQLGNVMIESSEIAYTYVRSLLGGDKDIKAMFEKNFIHLHVPAGATPKDGPSAGVTMAAALYSLARNRPIASNCAMTGELTLSGLVMPVGGIKEKIIAAKRAGVKRVILPAQNRPDFDEIPPNIRRGLKPIFVKKFQDMIGACFNGKK